ncbi:hypothetical protein CIB95_02565 [Lottiidibacillus patelloidae]|uniref:Asp23/Gls24 family envelope stress response protein n=1 Tax=Lottiidibacillus patelloidae TaxID=2670334 RepID=A0A263BXS8_9BACI|nr:Asp23/Gls24 family envelope stress response protein [Lottiidibacillus patelloidae]OZM58470.1 hypothetical protein CIB95_02565 [Lottiidibacillus patelloidae]
MIKSTLQYGELRIAEEVIGMIAMIAVSEVKGVADTVAGIKDELVRAINKRSMPRGIIVTNDEDNGVIIDLKIAVYYDQKLSEVCKNLQAHIKEQVEMMTGITVKEINIMVEQVNFSTQNN